MEDKLIQQDEPLAQIDIAELIRRVRTRKSIFWGFVCAGMILSIAYSILAKPIWEAKTVLYFPVRPYSLIASLGAGGSGGLGGLLSGGNSSSLNIFRGFLDSNSALTIVSEKSGIKKDQVNKFRRLETNLTNNELSISATSSDKQLALTIVQANLTALNDINFRTQGRFSKADVVVIQNFVKQLKSQVNDLEAKILAAYQGNTGIGFQPANASGATNQTNPVTATTWATQSKAIQLQLAGINAQIKSTQQKLNAASFLGTPNAIGIPAVTKLEPLLVQAEADLKVKSQYLGPESPTIRQLKAAVTGYQAQIRQEAQTFYTNSSHGLIYPGGNVMLQNYVNLLISRDGLEAQYTIVHKLAKEAPQQAINLTSLTSKFNMKYILLGKEEGELMMAQEQEMHDPVTWNVLDRPFIKGTPVNKHWLRNLADGLAVGILFGLLGAIRKPIH